MFIANGSRFGTFFRVDQSVILLSRFPGDRMNMNMKRIRKSALSIGLSSMTALTVSGWAQAEDVGSSLEGKVAPVQPGVSVQQPAAPDGDLDGFTCDGRPHVALTLSGGGGRGVAHIGVLKVLEEEGIKPDFIAGSSIGALIGVLYASGRTPQELEQMCLSGELKKGLLPSGLKWQAIKSTPGYALKRMIGMHPPIGMYKSKTMAKFISKELKPCVTQLDQLKIPVAVIATNLLDTSPVWIRKGKITDAVTASTAIPFVYQPVELNNALLVDGGLRSQLPTEVAAASCSPFVIGVRVHSKLPEISKKRIRNWLDYSDRVLTMVMAELERKGMENADVLIEPDLGDIETRSFEPEDMALAIKSGEVAARKMLPELRRRLARYNATASSGANQSH